MCVPGKFSAPSALQIACAFQESVHVIILSQNCAGNKLKSYEIMRIKMLAALDKTKPNTRIVRELNWAAVKHVSVK